MCSSLSVNERGYYKWLNNGERPKKWQSLLAEIHRILDENPDNARMESFFAMLKKEKLYRINTAKMTVEQVKKIIFRYVMIYYNRKRISTVNPGGWPPTVFREKSAVACTAA